MGDIVLRSSKYNINSFNEMTLEDYMDTLEISLCHKSRTLLHREHYYIKCTTAKANTEKVIELYSYDDNPLPKFISEFEDTCFYWYVQSMRDNNICSGDESPFISERDFHCGAGVSNHTFSHEDNSFTFQIVYNGKSYEYFANKLLPITNNRLTVNELMDCFWKVTNDTVTFNKHTRDANGNINGSIEIYELNETKAFFNIAVYGLQSYLYRLSKIHFTD
ncbi:MAG: hypothetical protein IJE43_15755 [Alphaproteobacteria bacterium]|nr:hypothetical protein [Alphaproteobacteria bacterium]